MEEKIDLKDRKILAELDFNARESITKIAKKIRISKEVALYRIKKLENSGIIKQYSAIINTAKLGYYYCRLFIKFQNTNKEIEQKIINHLKNNSKLAYLGIIDGSWDLAIGLWVRNLNEFEKFIDDFVFKNGRYILEKEISMGLHIWQFQYRYLLNKKETQEFETGGEKKQGKIDDTDKKLLVLLTQNARMGYEELSRKLKLTGKAISYRIKNLQKKQIIVGFRTSINYKKFGYSNNKILLYLQNLTKNQFKDIISYIKSLPNCIYITKPIGKSDLEFEVLSKDREEFFLIMKELRENFRGIIRSYNHFIVHEESISRFIPLKV